MIQDFVRTLCEERNISIHALEKQCEIGNGTIGRWNKDVEPSISTLRKIAEFFGINMSDLMKHYD